MIPDAVSAGARLLDQNRVNEALACFEACDDRRGWFGRAVALQLLGRLDEAEAAYLRVLEQMAQPEALANLVALAIEKFDLERVERYARRLLQMDPDSIVAWQALLVVAVERREFASAASYFARIDGRPAPASEGAIQYRLSGYMADRLRAEPVGGQNGAAAGSR